MARSIGSRGRGVSDGARTARRPRQRRPRSARSARSAWAARSAARHDRRRQRAAAREEARVAAQPRSRPSLEDAEREVREFASDGDRPFVLGLGVLLLMALLTLSGPLQSFLDGRARVDVLSTQAERLDERNDELDRRVDDLNDPTTIEMLAREQQGLVRPGEEAYVLVPPAEDQPVIESSPEEPSDEGVPWWRRAWRAVFGGGGE